MENRQAHAKAMHKALKAKLPHTFRHGKAMVKVYAVDQKDNMFSVLQAEAWYDGKPVPLDLPLHYVNAKTINHPLLDAEAHIAATVRYVAGGA